jgi:hypothetical protein
MIASSGPKKRRANGRLTRTTDLAEAVASRAVKNRPAASAPGSTSGKNVGET